LEIKRIFIAEKYIQQNTKNKKVGYYSVADNIAMNRMAL
jgi:hypothetical protein